MTLPKPSGAPGEAMTTTGQRAASGVGVDSGLAPARDDRLGRWLGPTALVVVILLLMAPPFLFNAGVVATIYLGLKFAALAQGWNIIGGYTGYAAFGQVAFYGIGVYAAGLLMTNEAFQLPFALAWPAAVLIAAAIAALIGIPILRLRGHYFAIATLSIGIAIGEVIKRFDFFKRAEGIQYPFLRLNFEVPLLNTPRERIDAAFYLMMLGVVVAGLLITWWITRHRLGYGLVAIRENEEAARVMGVPTTRYKITAFALAAFLAGLVGAVDGFKKTIIPPDEAFLIDTNVQSILPAVVGGPGTIFGPLLGAGLLRTLEEGAERLFPGGKLLLYALMVIVIVVFLPRGVISLAQRLSPPWRRLGGLILGALLGIAVLAFVLFQFLLDILNGLIVLALLVALAVVVVRQVARWPAGTRGELGRALIQNIRANRVDMRASPGERIAIGAMFAIVGAVFLVLPVPALAGGALTGWTVFRWGLIVVGGLLALLGLVRGARRPGAPHEDGVRP